MHIGGRPLCGIVFSHPSDTYTRSEIAGSCGHPIFSSGGNFHHGRTCLHSPSSSLFFTLSPPRAHLLGGGHFTRWWVAVRAPKARTASTQKACRHLVGSRDPLPHPCSGSPSRGSLHAPSKSLRPKPSPLILALLARLHVDSFEREKHRLSAPGHVAHPEVEPETFRCGGQRSYPLTTEA